MSGAGSIRVYFGSNYGLVINRCVCANIMDSLRLEYDPMEG